MWSGRVESTDFTESTDSTENIDLLQVLVLLLISHSLVKLRSSGHSLHVVQLHLVIDYSYSLDMEFLNWNGPSFIPEMIVTPGKSWTGLHIWNYCKNNLKKSNCPRGNLNLLLGEFSCQTFFGIFYLELFFVRTSG